MNILPGILYPHMWILPLNLCACMYHGLSMYVGVPLGVMEFFSLPYCLVTLCEGCAHKYKGPGACIPYSEWVCGELCRTAILYTCNVERLIAYLWEACMFLCMVAVMENPTNIIKRWLFYIYIRCAYTLLRGNKWMPYIAAH